MVSSCDLESTPFSKIRMGTRDSKGNPIVIDSHPHPNDAWMEYIKELKRIIAPAQ